MRSRPGGHVALCSGDVEVVGGGTEKRRERERAFLIETMLEMDSGDLSMVDLDVAEQGQSFYSPPEQSFRLRYKSSLVSVAASAAAAAAAGGDVVGSLPMKQLFAAGAAPVGANCSFRSSSSSSSNSSSSLGPETERVATMDHHHNHHHREKGLGITDAQSFYAHHLIPDAGMPQVGKHHQQQQQQAPTTLKPAGPYRFSCDAVENFGDTTSREQRDKAAYDTAAECSGDGTHEGSEVGRSDEVQLDASKANINRDQDIMSVITSSLSHLNFMQQNIVNNGNQEFSSGLKPTVDSILQRRQISQQMLDEGYMRSNVPQNALLQPSWDTASASQRHLNQQQQFINQLLLSRASQLLPSTNSDLAAAVAKFQLSAPRTMKQVFPTPKSTSDMWLSEEILNGCNSLNLYQNQQSARFDAQKFPMMNQDFLDMLRAPEHLKKESGLLNSLSLDQIVPNLMSPVQSSGIHLGLQLDHYSRKVFVGGLPPDIAEEEITQSFRQFGPLVVDWPHKAESMSYFPPKGYCFLLFQDEMSVQALISSCVKDEGKLYWSVSSPTIKDKPVQIRPWNLADSDFVMDGSQPLDPRKTVFVGGVPRPLRAVELAIVMNRLYGGVCYAGIDTDPELKYPKGAGRVAFSNQQSYIAAISARFVQLQHADIDKRVEVKPYVLDDQLCDECQGARCGSQFAPYFCSNVACLQYYCEHCWSQIHARPGREFHKPLVKEGADRPRTLPFRWC